MVERVGRSVMPDHADDRALIERLRLACPGPVSDAHIGRTVERCRADLAGSAPAGALPELVERLARQRLG